MKTVLILLSSTDRGGVEVWLSRVLKLIDDSKITIHILTRSTQKGKLEGHFRNMGIRVFRATNGYLGYLADFLRLHRIHNYDLIHNNLAHRGLLLNILAWKTPVLLSIHNSKFPSVCNENKLVNGILGIGMSLVYRLVLATSNKVSACSIDAQDWIRQMTGQQLIYNLPYGVDCLSETKHRPRKIDDVIRLISIGSLSYQKNYTFLFDAIRSLTEFGLDFELNIYGEGKLRDSLQDRIDLLGLSNRIFLRGVTDKVNEKILHSDIFLMTSHYEGLPVALLESLALGIPVLCADVPGIKVLVQDRYNGKLYSPNDKEEFLVNLKMMVLDWNFRKEISIKASHFIKKNYSIEASSEILYSLYRT